MPYIKQERREGPLGLGFDGNIPGTAGELNYVLSQVVWQYLEWYGGSCSPLGNECYQAYNDVIGVLECLKLEVYRRLVAPYEEEKMAENGDVFN